MKIKPILFSTDMVKAILDKTKTQTRRIIKPTSKGEKVYYSNDNKCPMEFREGFGGYELKPKYNIGDVIWVRETWQYSDDLENPYLYKQKYNDEHLPEYHNRVKWKPSIFMPKEACRIFLKVKNVRVEKLQDISEQDAIFEGIFVGDGLEQYKNYGKGYKWKNSAIDSFYSLWESINGKESWDENPYVWVYDFEITDKLEFKTNNI